jgi:hypothetical protein
MIRILATLALIASTLASAQTIGIAISPQKVAVAAGETQTFAARFFSNGQPVAGARVVFYNDACGYLGGGGSFSRETVTDGTGTASMAFTALNTGLIRCTMAAGLSADASVLFDVITFRPTNAEIAVTLDPPEPRPGQPFRIYATPKVGAFSLFNVDLTARVVAGTASASVTPGGGNTGQDGFVRIDVSPDGRIGDYQVELDYRGKTTRVAMAMPPNPWQDLWWSGAAENGWGMSIVQHRDVLFSIIYAYDANGKATWYVMPAGQWNESLSEFSGDVFIPHGSPYNNYDAAKFSGGAPAGHMKISFMGANSASLDYNIGGVAGHKPLTRILFGQGAASRIAGIGDMWWGGVAQNGWGLSVLQQGADLFTLWFTYDETGAPTWFVAPAGSWAEARNFRGSLYRTTGSPWLGGAYDPSALRMPMAGWYDLHFNDDATATFTYSLDAAPAVALPLTRIPF